MTSAAEPPQRSGTVLGGRAKLLLPLLLGALFAVSVHRLACAPLPPANAEFSGESMGTTWSVKLAVGEIDAATRAEVQRAVESALRGVDEAMSTWRDDSELSRFNAHASTEPFSASDEVLEVFRVAREVSALSDGAFDVTVAPIVTAWGFGATARIPGPPPAEELAGLRARVGWRRVEVRDGALAKSRADVVCDLSAIAKGYAVDRVAEALEARGFRDYLVEVGGEVRARGERLQGGAWRVAIERPAVGERELFEVLRLDGVALATSGDYRNFYETGGRRYSHTIDPRSARPVEHSLASVSVLHAEAVYADALATALNVLGPEAGYALAVREELAALFIVRGSDGEFSTRATPAFESARTAPGTD